MKILIKLLILFFIVISPCYAWGKKQKPVIILADSTQAISKSDFQYVFKTNSKIYFLISNPKGFKSDYIKYQIVKQDENAHIGGYTRVRNVTCRIKNKNSYADYFVLLEKGKYFIQIFDITNLQQWVAIQGFQVIDE